MYKRHWARNLHARPGMIDFVTDLFFNLFPDRKRSVARRGIIETARDRQQLSQNGCRLTIRKLGCQFGLQKKQSGADALGQQCR